MKKLIILLIIICGFTPLMRAMDGCNQQRMSQEAFRAKQKAFITEQANLTKEELNDKAWNLIRQGKDENTTETQYDEILTQVYDTRIASDKLEKSYFDKFKKILSCKKLYKIQRAEMRFHRELLKGINRKDGGGHRDKK